MSEDGLSASASSAETAAETDGAGLDGITKLSRLAAKKRKRQSTAPPCNGTADNGIAGADGPAIVTTYTDGGDGVDRTLFTEHGTWQPTARSALLSLGIPEATLDHFLAVAGGGIPVPATLTSVPEEEEENLSPAAAKLARLRIKGLYCDQARTTLYKLRKASDGRLVPQREDPPGMPALHQVSRPEGLGSRNPADEIRYLLSWSTLPWQPPVWVTGKDLASGDVWSLFPGVAISGRAAISLYSDIVKAQVAAFDIPVTLAPRATGLSPAAEGGWRFVLDDGRSLLATGVSPDHYTDVYDHELAGAQAAAWGNFVPPREAALPDDVSWLARELNDIDQKGRLWLLLCFGLRGLVASVVALGAAVFLVGESGSGKTSSANLVRNLTGPCPPDAPPHANFQATETLIELAVSPLRDVPALIDDFHPNDFDREAEIKKGYRIIDAVVTSSADGGEMRGRATRNIHKRPGTVIRGSAIMTAESYDGAMRSRMRRLIYLAYEKDDVNTEQLYDPETWRSCAAMVTKLGHTVIRAVLTQLECDLPAFRSWVRERDRVNTDHLFNLLMQARPAADRQIMQSVAMRYARAMTGADIGDVMTGAAERQAMHALSIYVLPLALTQIDLDGAGGPTSITREWVIDAIRTILTTGRGHLLSHEGKSLALVHPELLGALLSDSGYGRSSGAYEPRGSCIGFLSADQTLRYFRPNELRVLLMAQAKAEKLVWRWTAQTFPAAMMGLGLVEQHDEGRSSKTERIGGEDPRKYLVLSADSTEGEKPSGNSGNSGNKTNNDIYFNNLAPQTLLPLPKPTAVTAVTDQLAGSVFRSAEAEKLEDFRPSPRRPVNGMSQEQVAENDPSVAAVTAVGFGSGNRTAALKPAEILGSRDAVTAVTAVAAVSEHPIEPAHPAAGSIATLPPQTPRPVDPLAPRRLPGAAARRAERARAQVQDAMAREAFSASPEPAGGLNGAGRTAAPDGDTAVSASPRPAARPNGEGSPAALPADRSQLQPAAQPGKKEDTRPIGALGPDGLWIMSTDGSIECQPLGKKWRPKSARLSELTDLAVLKNLRQLWVSAPWAAAAGLPNNLSDEAVREGIRHRFASFVDAPGGWKPDQPGRIKPWLNVRSESSEIVISMPTLAPDLAFGGATNAETMLRAIGRYRALLKFNFMVNPSVVFSNMMTKMHEGPGTLDLSASMAPKDFPEVFNIDGPITRDVWARPLTKSELLTGTHVHVFDKNGMYLAAMSSLAVGFGIPEHTTRPMTFSKGMVGYFKTRITPPPSWPATLPHPCFVRAGDGEFQWQIHPSLVLALEHNCAIDIVEALIFPESHQPFKPVYERLRDARDVVTPAADEADQVASVAIKQTYTHPIGNFANKRYRDSEDKRDLQRPDWRHCIRSQARANGLRNLVKFNLNPFGIRTDAIYLVSASSDPMEAAGALPIGTTLRAWKHLKTFPLSALPREFFDGKAADSPQRYLDAIKKISHG